MVSPGFEPTHILVQPKLDLNAGTTFRSQKSKFFIDLGSISEKPVDVVKKLLYYLLVGMDKVKNFCNHSMSLKEITYNIPTSGHFWSCYLLFLKNHGSN